MNKFAGYLRYIARAVLLLIASGCFIFALLSGSEQYGGGMKGILLNSPNALPWLLLLIFVYITFRWELLGGIIIAITGLLTIKIFSSPLVFFAVSFPLLLLGGFFITSWYLTNKTT